MKDGRECLLLVNAGNETVAAKLAPDLGSAVGAYDLWRAGAYRFMSGQDAAPLCLAARESLLLFAVSNEEYALLPEKTSPVVLTPPVFEPVSDDEQSAVKVYAADAVLGGEFKGAPEAVLPLSGEEMIGLSVNGADCDVSFFPPHRLRVPEGVLREGLNHFVVTVEGSLANVYGRKVPYGLTM